MATKLGMFRGYALKDANNNFKTGWQYHNEPHSTIIITCLGNTILKGKNIAITIAL